MTRLIQSSHVFAMTQQAAKLGLLFIITFSVACYYFVNKFAHNDVSKHVKKSGHQYLERFENHEFPKWQRVSQNPQLLTYSSFQMSQKLVRIIGIIKQSELKRHSITCKITSVSKLTIYSTGVITILPEHRDKPFAAVFIDCPFSGNVSASNVSIKNSPKAKYSSRIVVEQLEKKRYDFLDKKFVICVPELYSGPLMHNMDKRLIQFFAFYYPMMIDRFVFYDYSMPQSAKQVIDKAKSQLVKSVVDTYSWKLLKFGFNYTNALIHSKGHIAHKHDCLYRNYADNILFVDIDEFVVQKDARKLKSYFQELEMRMGASVFVIRQTMFPEDVNKKMSGKRTKSKGLAILDDVFREDFIDDPGVRSKLFVTNPSAIKHIRIHKVAAYNNESRRSHLEKTLAADELLVHHHRLVYPGGRRKNFIKDDSLLRYSNQITKFVQDFK